jgi:hypothetical protein
VGRDWLIGGLLASCAFAVAAEVCVPLGTTVLVSGRATQEGLETYDGSFEGSYVLALENPLCVLDTRNHIEPEGRTLISRVELVGSKPPTGVQLAVSGPIEPKNHAEYSMRPTSIRMSKSERTLPEGRDAIE